MRPLVALFVFGTAIRLLFLFVADQPLLYTHQYTYFTNAMRIAEHERPLHYVGTSEEWRTWDEVWTIAPLYFVFLGGLLKATGLHLFPVQVLQCALGGLTAAGAGALGRQMAGRAGLLAGVVYAIYGPAIEITSTTMTENLHTPLLVLSVLAVTRATEQASSRGGAFAAGMLIGVTALTRSVTTGFLGMAALLAMLRHRRQGVAPAALILAGGACVILPWTARNAFVIGDAVLIESAAFENIWYANALDDRVRRERQLGMIHEQSVPADRRRMALHFALRGIRRNPEAFVHKVETNFRHFFRPEGLYNFLRIERSQEGWRHAMSLLLDDPLLLGALPLFGIFVLAGRPSPARTLTLLWLSYYLFLLIVVFHNEIRYRSAFVPFLFPGAIAGAVVWRAGERRTRAWIGVACGLTLVALELTPFAPYAWRWAQSDRASARPWLADARALLNGGDAEAALGAYDEAARRSTPAGWIPRLVRPRLLQTLGRPADEALQAAHSISWNEDPWLALEVAWRALPPPVADEIRLGEDDYGAVRGFLHPRGVAPDLEARRGEWNRYERLGHVLPPPGAHRWSRHRAWLRLQPATRAPRYRATLWMGVPFPATRETADVSVEGGAGRERFVLDREIRAFTFDVAPGADGSVHIRLDAPTWSRSGEPADQGVRVDRVSVAAH